jgi:hypothetical protein
VNDLDLSVRTASGHFYTGNGATNSDLINGDRQVTQLSSLFIRTNSLFIQDFDDLNNVEQVTVSLESSGYYSVTVFGRNVPQGPQSYSLVVTGAIQYAPGHCSSTCPNGCSNAGTCKDSVCICNKGVTGIDCSVQGQPLQEGRTAIGQVDSFGWSYFSFTVPKGQTNKYLVFQVDVTSGDPDFYAKYGDYPSLISYDLANENCDECTTTMNLIEFPAKEVQEGTYLKARYCIGDCYWRFYCHQCHHASSMAKYNFCTSNDNYF